MHHFSFLYTFIDSAVHVPALLTLAIMLGVFVLEDPTTLIVGFLASDGIIPIPLALGSLYAGIVFGDIVLYSIGWLASTHPRLAKYVDHDSVAPFRAWLETRYILTIFSARFVPFARFPTYTSSGFFRSPLTTFILVVTVAASIWTTFLFFAAYWFGALTASYLGPVRWGVALLALLALFFAGRHNLRARQIKKTAADTSADTHTPSV